MDFKVISFEPISPTHTDDKELDTQITIHINEVDKAILRAEALASQKSMSALIREWIEERLDLPLAA